LSPGETYVWRIDLGFALQSGHGAERNYDAISDDAALQQSGKAGITLNAKSMAG
jgi:hypothetical protein